MILKIQGIRYFAMAILLLLSVFPATQVTAQTQYISDELNVPVRSGASNQHRIIRFLNSGAALTVLSTTDDGKYTEVQLTNDKTGWVLSENLMTMPSARERLVVANKKLQNSKTDIKQLKKAIAQLRSELKAIKAEHSALQNERTNLSNSLEDLKITAANPLSLAKKNKKLKKELEQAHANESMLEKDNQRLRNDAAQEWFLIGGSVAIGSLILGLLLTRINWRRKRDSWGDSF